MSFEVRMQIKFLHKSFRAEIAEFGATVWLMNGAFLVGFQVLAQCDLEDEGFGTEFTLERLVSWNIYFYVWKDNWNF